MIARPNAALAQIHTQIMWNRLIAVVEEQAQTMIRTAFSTSVREAGDLSAGVFDRQGRMLAQAVTGTPGHVNSMANGVRHFLDVYPIDSMKPGDHFIAEFDAEEDAIVFRRIAKNANWLAVLKACPVDMDDLPARRREYPKTRKL